jgi:hypothetical protein
MGEDKGPPSEKYWLGLRLYSGGKGDRDGLRTGENPRRARPRFGSSAPPGARDFR